MARVFSQEDGNLNTKSIITSRSIDYSDIDLSFENKPGASSAQPTDIFKKTDAASVKQAVKNLLMTNFAEKPFQPYFGGDLNRFLFNLDTEFDEIEIKDTIAHAINNYEPRALLRAVDAILLPDNNTVNISVKFRVLNVTALQEVTISITRLR